jgi:hypothetical protein
LCSEGAVIVAALLAKLKELNARFEAEHPFLHTVAFVFVGIPLISVVATVLLPVALVTYCVSALMLVYIAVRRMLGEELANI